MSVLGQLQAVSPPGHKKVMFRLSVVSSKGSGGSSPGPADQGQQSFLPFPQPTNS